MPERGEEDQPDRADRGGESRDCETAARPATGGRCAPRATRRGQDGDAEQDHAPRPAAAEGVFAAVDDAVHERHEADDGQADAEQVDAAGSRDRGIRAPSGPPRRCRPATIGTLIRKTEPHQKRLQQRAADHRADGHAQPTAPAQMPMALPRSRGSKTFEMIDRVEGMIAAAPNTHQGPGLDQLGRGPRVGRRQRGQPEQGQARSAGYGRRPNRSPRMPAVNNRPAKTSV